MRTLAAAPAALLLLAACATTPAAKPEPAPTGPPAFPTGIEVRATGTPGQAAAVAYRQLGAKVKAVDVAARTVTLETTDGQVETLKVGPEEDDLAAIAVGDVIHLEFKAGLILEYQAPGTSAVPLQSTAVASPAAGAMAAEVQATVTVTAIDLASRLVTFKGPKGNRYQVTAGPKIPLEKLKVGDQLLATYVEAVAVGVERAGGASY